MISKLKLEQKPTLPHQNVAPRHGVKSQAIPGFFERHQNVLAPRGRHESAFVHQQFSLPNFVLLETYWKVVRLVIVRCREPFQHRVRGFCQRFRRATNGHRYPVSA